MEELLESFATAALGLEPGARISDGTELPEHKPQPTYCAPEVVRICAVWGANPGRVTICATYHHDHSRRVKGHVLWFEWRTHPDVYHEGWWRVEPRWPRDWIKGHGRAPGG
jgi:hypothetical protein